MTTTRRHLSRALTRQDVAVAAVVTVVEVLGLRTGPSGPAPSAVG
jgi:hypothetical protein